MPGTAAWYVWVREHYQDRSHRGWFNQMKNNGLQVQIGKAYGKHNVLSSWTYDRSKLISYDLEEGGQAIQKRWSVTGYLQDKIFLSDKWELTPSLRFARYSDITKENRKEGEFWSGGVSGTVTPSLNTQYAFDDRTSIYFGYSRVRRPVRIDAYREHEYGVSDKLNDERGDVWTLGMRRDLSDRTTISLNYDYTRMSNTAADYWYYNPVRRRDSSKSVNAREVKKSFNIAAQHRFDKHLSLHANYFHAYDRYWSKNVTFDPAIQWAHGDVNYAINRLRPANTYTADLAYENRKLYTALAATWYTGCDPDAYTGKRALILDLNVNYAVLDDLTLYIAVNNLTNRAYETIHSKRQGIGAWPEPGRAFLFGVKYKF